jgi:FAD/FMN-containing dehydrogenase
MTISPFLDSLDLTCPVYRPGDDGYAAEVFSWNVAHPPQPDVVVGATCAEDVATAVRWAARHGLRIGVQATGHGAVSTMTGGLLVSTRRLDTLTIDPAAGTARIGAGVKWARVIEAAAPFGLAPLTGSSSDAGAVGYTVGGGLGPLGRRYGYAADHVHTLEVVTADGAVRTVDARRDPDLFWAVRGGKANFGIVTAMTIGLVPVARLYGGGIFFPGAAAGEVLHAYREWAATLQEETTTSIALLRLPPLPELPEPLRGQFVVHLRVAHLGDAASGEALLAPMRAVAPAIIDAVGEMPYTSVDAIHSDPVDPMPYWERAVALADLPAEAVDRLLELVGPQTQVPLAIVEIRQLGGALSRPAAVPNAVPARDARWSLLVIAPLVPELADVAPQVGGAVLDALAQYRTATGPNLNFAGAADPRTLLASWSPADRNRLLAIKQAYDPQNLFSARQSII